MSKKVKQSKFLTWFTKITAFPPTYIFFKPKVYYEDKITSKKKLPKSFILVSNHTSLMDFPLYLMVFFRRNIRFLMAEVLMNKPVLGWFLYKLGGILANRDSIDFSFMSESLETLDRGESVGVFPQGRLPVGEKPFPFKPGVGMISLYTDALILPVYTDGNYGIFKRARIVIGNPIDARTLCSEDLPEEEKAVAITEALESKIYELKDILTERIGEK